MNKIKKNYSVLEINESFLLLFGYSLVQRAAALSLIYFSIFIFPPKNSNRCEVFFRLSTLSRKRSSNSRRSKHLENREKKIARN